MSHRQTITSGTLMTKIQRQEAIASSSPPTSGPSTAEIAPHAVQLPIAAPRSSRGNVFTITASELGHEQRAGDALQRARRDQQADARRERAQHRGRAEAADAEREHAPLAVEVAERAADQDQRAERQQVAVDDPLLPGEAAAEPALDRRQRDVDDGAVEQRDARAEDRRRSRVSRLTEAGLRALMPLR